MVTKNMAYWKAKFKNSPIKQDDNADTEDTDTGTEDTDTGNEETSKSGGGGAGVGKDLAMAAVPQLSIKRCLVENQREK